MSWSTPSTPVPGPPQASVTETASGINFQITLNDVGYVDQYAAVKTALETLMDHISTLSGWEVQGAQSFSSNSGYTP